MIRTGLIPSPADPRDWDFTLFGAATGTKRRSVDATGTHVRRYQGAQSCTAYTVTTAAQDLDLKYVELGAPVRVARLGDDGAPMLDDQGELVLEAEPQRRREALPLLSGAWSYAGARRLWFRQTGVALPPSGIPDGGSSYRHNIMVLRDIVNGGGARTEDVFPDRVTNISCVPPAHVDQADPLVRVDGYYRIRGEGNAEVLRDGIIGALEGFLRGECSKPMGSMMVGPGFAGTPEGEVYDDANPGPESELGSHAMLISGYDVENDCAVFDNTWPGTRTFRVRIDHLAERGFETWVLRRLVYIPRRAA